MGFADSVDVSLHGADGSIWNISGPRSAHSPVVMVEGSVGDLFDAPATTHFKPRAGQAGTTYRGFRMEERNIVLRVLIYADSSTEWARVDSDFRRALDYDKQAELVVRSTMSGERRLKVRLGEAPSYQWDKDPHYYAASLVEFVVTAEDPFWYSAHEHDEFVFDGLNWYGGTVTVSNPGDVPTWPKWVLTAPAKFILPDVSFRDDDEKDRTIVLPFQPLGREVLVDTDPLEELITANDNTLLWAEMGGQFFQNPIPPRTPPTQIPVAVDPLPNLPVVLPPGWREWIASEVRRWAEKLGAEEVFRRTPEDVAKVIHEALYNPKRPPWLQKISDPILDFLNVDYIAGRLINAWGQTNNMAGATAQIRVDHKWSRPWGME